MTGAAYNRGSSEQTVSTPWELVRAVERRFGWIAVDLAATAENAKAKHWLTEKDDSLSVDWFELGRSIHGDRKLLWLNPPYANIGPWAAKCAHESEFGARIAMLVPASVGTNWWRDHVHDRALVLLLNGRVKFIGHQQGYPKDLTLCVYGERPGYEIWSWRS